MDACESLRLAHDTFVFGLGVACGVAACVIAWFLLWGVVWTERNSGGRA